MTKRIFRSITIVAIVVFLSCISLFMCVQYDYFTLLQEKQLISQTDLVYQGIKSKGELYLNDLSLEDIQIIVYDKNEDILFNNNIFLDNDSTEQIINDLSKSKFDSKEEIIVHDKSLFETELISYREINDSLQLILISSQSTIIKILLEMTYPIVLILLFAIGLSLFLAYNVSKSIVKPLNEINLDDPLLNKGYDELSPMLQKLDSQKNKLIKQSVELKYRQDEFLTVTENLNEGLILLAVNGEILSINRAALKLFGIGTRIIKNISEIDIPQDLIKLINKAYTGSSGEIILDYIMGKFQFDINPVMSDNKITGVVILIFDVTEKENSEKMRREFSANVSHELKTPLQSISGYAELLKHGIVKTDDIPTFGGKIYSEAQRMIHLVEDIIHLSRLDEGAGEMPYSTVDIYKYAVETAENLKPEAEAMNVDITVEGSKAEINAIPQLIAGIIFNLCDNAIKYNKSGGTVNIIVENNHSNIKLTVKDTGIGIPYEDFSRIFERFYRVDKSHSKEVGGTGLGLSIVKHATLIHNAQIELKSAINEGTEISVVFPK